MAQAPSRCSASMWQSVTLPGARQIALRRKMSPDLPPTLPPKRPASDHCGTVVPLGKRWYCSIVRDRDPHGLQRPDHAKVVLEQGPCDLELTGWASSGTSSTGRGGGLTPSQQPRRPVGLAPVGRYGL